MDGKELLRSFGDVDEEIVEEMLEIRRFGLSRYTVGRKGRIMRILGIGAAATAAAEETKTTEASQAP